MSLYVLCYWSFGMCYMMLYSPVMIYFNVCNDYLNSVGNRGLKGSPYHLLCNHTLIANITPPCCFQLSRTGTDWSTEYAEKDHDVFRFFRFHTDINNRKTQIIYHFSLEGENAHWLAVRSDSLCLPYFLIHFISRNFNDARELGAFPYKSLQLNRSYTCTFFIRC